MFPGPKWSLLTRSEQLPSSWEEKGQCPGSILVKQDTQTTWPLRQTLGQLVVNLPPYFAFASMNSSLCVKYMLLLKLKNKGVTFWFVQSVIKRIQLVDIVWLYQYAHLKMELKQTPQRNISLNLKRSSSMALGRDLVSQHFWPPLAVFWNHRFGSSHQQAWTTARVELILTNCSGRLVCLR